MILKKLKVEEIIKYIERCDNDVIDRDIITYWYNPVCQDFFAYKDLVEKYGMYDYKNFLSKGYLPLPQINVRQLQLKFIKDIEPIDIKEWVEYAQKSGKDFESAFNEIKNRYNGLSESWTEFYMEEVLDIAIQWLKKNKLRYKVKIKNRIYLKEVIEKETNQVFVYKERFTYLKKLIKKLKKLNAINVSFYVVKYPDNEIEDNIVTYWYKPDGNDFIYYNDLESEYGNYDYEKYLICGLIPIDQFDETLFRKKFIENLEPADISNEIKEYIQSTGEEFSIGFNIMLDEFEDIAETYYKIFSDVSLKKAIGWLERNNLAYKIKKDFRMQLHENKIILFSKINNIIRKLTKLNAFNVTFFMRKCDFDDTDKDIVTFWYNKKNKEFISYRDMEKKYGKYDFDEFSNQGYLPLDQLNVYNFQNEFVEKLEPNELKDKMREFIQIYREDPFRANINNIMNQELDDLGEIYNKECNKAVFEKTIVWLEKNNLPYKIKRKYRELFETSKYKIRK